jgi:hypothetical protein
MINTRTNLDRSFFEPRGITPNNNNQPAGADSEQADHFFRYVCPIACAGGRLKFRCVWHENEDTAAAAVAAQLRDGEGVIVTIKVVAFIAAIEAIRRRVATSVSSRNGLSYYVVILSSPEGLVFCGTRAVNAAAVGEAAEQGLAPWQHYLLTLDLTTLLTVVEALKDGKVNQISCQPYGLN